MSADTYIFVDKKTLEVWQCTASCTCTHKKHCLECQKFSLLGKGKNLEEALEIAEKNDDYLNEYGISFKLWCK